MNHMGISGHTELPKMLSSKQVMDILNISRTTLNRLIRRGELRVFKIGASLRFKDEDIKAFIEAHEKKWKK